MRLGEALLQKLWVSAPSSTKSSDGLGPLFNARSCQSCHTGRRPGRGAEPLVRLSIAPGIDDPQFGRQLQPFAVQGLPAEPRPDVVWHSHDVTLADGLTVTLRRPAYSLPGPPRMLSPRMPPPLLGLGLLEAIPEAQILAPPDNPDGIAGRPNRVWSEAANRQALGRFGWKAGEAGLPDQTASAFSLDLGLSTPLRPQPWGDCTPLQSLCREAPHGLAAGESTEVAAPLFGLVVTYLRRLPPPSPRPAPARGAALFAATGCAACHRADFTLADGRPVRPYSDLLLHDMGEGLADHRPEFQAGGRDWRTAPLWGLGSRPLGAVLLHDGRAASPLEAILWHGGEAAPARERVRQLSTAERDALLAFLESL